MKSLAPCLAVMLAGLCLALGAGVAMATDPGSRGGQALETRKAPPLPKQKRGSVKRVPGVTRLAFTTRGGEAR